MNDATRSRLLHLLAWSCVVLMLLVVAASAWLRLSQPRPTCNDWPACQTVIRPATQAHSAMPPAAVPSAATPATVARPPATDAVRGLHRTAASLTLVASLALAWLALGRQPRRHAAGTIAMALVLVALLLAALGVVTPGSRSRAVLLGNLLGGHLMLALAWRLLRQLRAPPTFPAGGAARIVALLLLLQAALGVLAGAGGPAASIHLALAIIALPLLGWLGWQARLHGRRAEGAALLGLAAVQGLLGGVAAGLAATGATSALVSLTHNLGAACLLALLFGLMASAKLDPGQDSQGATG